MNNNSIIMTTLKIVWKAVCTHVHAYMSIGHICVGVHSWAGPRLMWTTSSNAPPVLFHLIHWGSISQAELLSVLLTILLWWLPVSAFEAERTARLPGPLSIYVGSECLHIRHHGCMTRAFSTEKSLRLYFLTGAFLILGAFNHILSLLLWVSTP